MTYTTADFRNAQFATHEDGRIAMRSGRFPVDPWEDSTGIHHSDAGMNHVGFIPLPNLADALIAQQQTMQASLDEAIREVSERVWGEGSVAALEAASQGMRDFQDGKATIAELHDRGPRNPYARRDS